jgi:hypothetical protein
MSAANDGDAIAMASRPAQAARMKRFIGKFLIVRFRANAGDSGGRYILWMIRTVTFTPQKM